MCNLLIGLMAIFALGNMMSALAPDCDSLMFARAVTLLNHDAFSGVGLILGNMWGRRAANRAIDHRLIVVRLAFTVLMRWPLPAAFAILTWSFAIVPPPQMRVMEAAKGAPSLALAVSIGAFNFGNAIGAAPGSAVINAGLGDPAFPVAGAAMAPL